jgi:hypothetical protein
MISEFRQDEAYISWGAICAVAIAAITVVVALLS